MSLLFDILISLVSGCFAGLGFGGGWILFAYLSVFGKATPSEARGMLLLLFLPCAAAALIGHAKNGLLQPRVLWLPALLALAGAAAGFALFPLLDAARVRLLMGLVTAVIGASQLAEGLRGKQ